MSEILYQAKGDNSGVAASEDVPNVMKAVVALGKEGGDRKGNPLGYEFRENVDTPRLSEGEVLLKVEYSGICHTDLLCLDGILVVNKPRIPGHEFAGTVVAVAPDAETGYLDNKMVALALYGGTGRQPNLSKDAIFTGVAVDGGFADYFKIKPEYLIPIPNGISTKHAFAAGDALLTSRHAVSKCISGYGKDEAPKVVVYGATGGLGVATILNLIGAGVNPEDIFAVDVRQQYLDELKEKLGLHVINSQGQRVAGQIKQMAGGRVDAVIDCFGSGGNIKKAYSSLEELVKAGMGDEENQFNKKSVKNWLTDNFISMGTISDAYDVVRKGGHVEVIGSRGDHILRPTGKFMETEVTSSGPWGGTPEDAEVVLQSIEENKIGINQLELLLGKQLPFTEAGFSEGVEDLRNAKVMGRIYFKM
jgi:D-arabinose 1-dehydrogenase-like Zn-dependent alcohol dehydrogenase